MKGLEKGWLLIAFETKIPTSSLQAGPHFCDIQYGIFSPTLCVLRIFFFQIKNALKKDSRVSGGGINKRQSILKNPPNSFY